MITLLEAPMKPLISRELHGGFQYIYRFANNYGASLVRTPFSYGGARGLFELAVLKFNGSGPMDWDLCFDTEITGDVIGNLAVEDVFPILLNIKDLQEERL